MELLLHRSRVLEIVLEKARDWFPIVHDSVLFFLDSLGEEPLLERLLDQAALSANAQRGEQVLENSLWATTRDELAELHPPGNRPQRADLMQLFLCVHLNDAKRLRNHRGISRICRFILGAGV